MFYCPYANMFKNYWHRVDDNASSIRIFHASPNSPAIDVYANGTLIAQNIAYKQFSNYIPFISGFYNIEIYTTGQKSNPVISAYMYIPPDNVFTLAVIGTLPNLSLEAIPEPQGPQNFGRPCIRFVHLSPDTPAVDISQDSTVLFNNVNYTDYTTYACIPAGTYAFFVSISGTKNAVLSIPGLQLSPNNYYTVYIVGLTAGSPVLEAVPVLESGFL